MLSIDINKQAFTKFVWQNFESENASLPSGEAADTSVLHSLPHHVFTELVHKRYHFSAACWVILDAGAENYEYQLELNSLTKAPVANLITDVERQCLCQPGTKDAVYAIWKHHSRACIQRVCRLWRSFTAGTNLLTTHSRDASVLRLMYLTCHSVFTFPYSGKKF